MDTKEETVSSVTLMILGNELEPSAVSDLLRLEPSQSWTRGEEKRLAKSSYYDWGGWKRFSPKSDKSVEAKIADWLVMLEGKEEAFEKMKNSGWRASLDVFIAFDEVATISLSNDITRKIGELSLELDFSLNAEKQLSKAGIAHNVG